MLSYHSSDALIVNVRPCKDTLIVNVPPSHPIPPNTHPACMDACTRAQATHCTCTGVHARARLHTHTHTHAHSACTHNVCAHMPRGLHADARAHASRGVRGREGEGVKRQQRERESARGFTFSQLTRETSRILEEPDRWQWIEHQILR
jgi:hypothetical protein